MNKKLVKYAFSICVKENIYDVHTYNEYAIDKRYCLNEEDRLDLPRISYFENNEEFKELEKMLNEYHANQQLKNLIKQTGWFKASMYLILLKLGNWLKSEKRV